LLRFAILTGSAKSPYRATCSPSRHR